MSFLISDAMAEAGSAGMPQGDLMGFIPLIVIFIIFYFLLIRPQAKKAKEHKAMVATLGKGDEVITSGGLIGKITVLGDEFVTVEVADNTQVHVQRPAVTSVVPKGTIKSL
ncbi:MAG TPA: preprotein translocase subunit YajC [Chromatiaceae bacterium]|nr:preprotein translocase subunit YajC [Chromatiaceae bacterium]HIB84905.1 preprotein translocase subunit YajC [Chromatiaceae bacterium]HIN82768.1 preprotein translocase subunit YajC [Chromatiales bacterium]HIO14026.1 preprotein translocase subunit YajC [Chromatiales bacterium]HIO54429.1 preprotein translocase subunit YajC [Chromatiales bacterium]